MAKRDGLFDAEHHAGVSMKAGLEHTARKRDAIRILFILDQAGVKTSRDSVIDAVKVIKAEKSLQAMDFWVRNPDYLAAELLSMHEAEPSAGHLGLAEIVMQGDEPDIRRLGMLRFLFGAWEQIDDAMATLDSYGLAKTHRVVDPQTRKVKRTDFYLLQAGADMAQQLAAEHPLLAWYRDRAALVKMVAGKDNGSKLKKRQYNQAEYAGARHGDVITPIKGRVLERLSKLREEENV